MAEEITKIVKYIFLLHFIVGLVLGAFWFILPEYWSVLSGWPVETASGRIVGMATLVMAVGSFMAYMKMKWDNVEIYVVMELVFNILGAIGMVWNIFTVALPIVAWVVVGLLGLFSILFLYVFFTMRA
jgi:O-antigen/teichoic acid export membrane protein